MWQAFFSDWGLVFRGIAVFILVIVLMAAFFWALRRFGTRALGGAGGQRGRQPRLAVIETTMIDQRRQLWLVRRDNVEHLIMTGGPTDLVVEPNIVRGAAAAPAREPARVTPTLADALPRPLPLADGGNWPLQPEAPPRPQRAAAPPPAPKAFETEPEEPAEEWSPLEESERAPPPPRIEPALRAVPASRAESPRRPEPPLRAEPPARPEPPLRAEPELRPDRKSVV